MQVIFSFKILENIFDGQTLLNQIKKIKNTFSENIFLNIVISLGIIIFLNIYFLPLLYYMYNKGNILLIIEIIILLIFIITFFKLILTQIFKNQDKEGISLIFDDEPLNSISEKSNDYKNIEIILDLIQTKHINNNYYSIAFNGSWGTGKTSILKTLYSKLNETNNYYLIWINVWKIKDFNKIIIEIENNFFNLIKKSYFIIPRDFFYYFELLNNLNINEILKKLIDKMLKLINKKSFEQSQKSTEKLINNALKHQNKDKIIIFFDESDRIYDKIECLNILKAIRYVTNFKNVITISGIDIDKVQSLLCLDNDIDGSSFLYKIFNMTFDSYSLKSQSDLVLFARNLWNDLKIKLNNKDIFLSIEDSKKIQENIESLINNEKIYNLFESYRQIKLTFNDFLFTLIIFNNHIHNSNISDFINPMDIFLFSLLKNIDREFYYKILVDISIKSQSSQDDTLTNIFIIYLRDKLTILDKTINEYILKDNQAKKIFSVFERIGFQLNSSIDNYSKLIGNYIGTKSDDPKKIIGYTQNLYRPMSIINRNVFNFYIQPILLKFQFSNSEIDIHLNELLKKKEKGLVEKIIENKLLSLDEHSNDYEKKTLIVEYLSKLQKIFELNNVNNDKNYKKNIYNIYSNVIIEIINIIIDKSILNLKENITDNIQNYFFEIINKLFWQAKLLYIDEDLNILYLNKELLKAILKLFSYNLYFLLNGHEKITNIFYPFIYDSNLDSLINNCKDLLEKNELIIFILFCDLYYKSRNKNTEQNKLLENEIKILDFILEIKIELKHLNDFSEYNNSYNFFIHENLILLCRSLNQLSKQNLIKYCNYFEKIIIKTFNVFKEAYSETIKEYIIDFTVKRDFLLIILNNIKSTHDKLKSCSKLIEIAKEIYNLFDKFFDELIKNQSNIDWLNDSEIGYKFNKDLTFNDLLLQIAEREKKILIIGKLE